MFCQESKCSSLKVEGRNYCFNHIYVCSAENCSKRISISQQSCSVHQYMTCQIQGCSTKIAQPEPIPPVSYWGGLQGIHTEQDKQNFYRREEVLARTCLDHQINFALRGCQDLTCWELNGKVSGTNYCLKHAKVCKGDFCSKRISTNQDYCEIDWLKLLVKKRTSIAGEIKAVARFSTWWNNNLATVVAYYDGYYRNFLLVYDQESDKVRVFPQNLSTNYWGEHLRKQHNCLADAQTEASWLRSELNKGYGQYHEHPILLIHPYSDCSRSFGELVGEPYVKKEEIGSENKDLDILFLVRYSSSRPVDLNNIFKPLDVVWVKKYFESKRYYHIGVYLAKDAILHYADPDAFLIGDKKARITGWNDFLKGGTGKIVRYHPIIPFKHYQKIIEQAIKAYWVDYGKDKYDLANNNCEHLANSLVYGINYSSQVEDRKGEFQFKQESQIAGAIVGSAVGGFFAIPTFGLSLLIPGLIISHSAKKDADGYLFKTNNGKGSTINLKNEINSWENNSRFDNLTSYRSSRIAEYEQEYQAQIQAPIKTGDCVIM